jgi:hypothetical protein
MCVAARCIAAGGLMVTALVRRGTAIVAAAVMRSRGPCAAPPSVAGCASTRGAVGN